jgi:hypothetical protein
MMKSLLHSEETQPADQRATGLSSQAIWVSLHTLLALGAWFALMLIGYAVNPVGVPQWVILASSAAVPLAVGFFVTRIRHDEMATVVWLVGIIWALVFSLYLLDLPTGAGHCYQCSATEKLARSFLSLPSPSGLVDDDTPFLVTWPAAALIGYSIGAKLGVRRGRSRQ